MQRALGITAALIGAAAVMLGAFGAHALRGHLDDSALQIWHTAVEYQFWHVLALLGIAQRAAPGARLWLGSGAAFVVGIVLFSGSLYALALGAPRWIGFVTPLGGLALIAGWVLMLVAWYGAARK